MFDKRTPTAWPSFDAVLFDMDGTLIDSEDRTDEVIVALLEAGGIHRSMIDDPMVFHGTTWEGIAAQLRSIVPSLGERSLAAELQDRFHRSLVATPPPEVPGAWETLRACLRSRPTGIVTSSQRESLEVVLSQAGFDPGDLLTICAEDVRSSKPAPEGYLAAASALGISPGRCLVFEDSPAGLAAARSAGMAAIAIARRRSEAVRRQLAAMAVRVISDFTELPRDFFLDVPPGADA